MLYHYLVVADNDVSYVVSNYEVKEHAKGKKYLLIPEDATFATRHEANKTIYFRKNGYWNNGEKWIHSGYNKIDFEKDEIVWERQWKPVTVIKESSRDILNTTLPFTINTDVMNIDWKVVYFKKWLEGKPIQYKLGGTHWHNMTENSLSYFAHTSVQLRDRPTEIEIDGKLFSPEQAINYLKNNYL